jgi:hypothetical protein
VRYRFLAPCCELKFGFYVKSLFLFSFAFVSDLFYFFVYFINLISCFVLFSFVCLFVLFVICFVA